MTATKAADANYNAATATVDVTVEPDTFSIGVLNGAGLVLQNNGADDLAVSVDGNFTFASALVDGTPYAVTVSFQPLDQTCEVANGSGSVAGSDVTGVVISCSSAAIEVPDAPTSVHASMTGNGLVVSWNAPTNDGGSSILSYVATAQPGGASCTVSGTPPPTTCTIFGLQGGGYTVTVTAINAAGMGGPGVGGVATTAPTVIPTLSTLGLALMVLLSGLMAWPVLRARASL